MNDYYTSGKGSIERAAKDIGRPMSNRIPEAAAQTCQDAPRQRTATERLTCDACANTERLMNAVERLRNINNRLFGGQAPTPEPVMPEVLGNLSALDYQLCAQRRYLSDLEDMIEVAEGI